LLQNIHLDPIKTKTKNATSEIPKTTPQTTPFTPSTTWPHYRLSLVHYSVGWTPTEKEGQEFGQSVADEHGNVSWDSFSRIFSQAPQLKADPEDTAKYLLAEAFRVYDKDENGLIPINDFRSILTTIGESLSYEEVDQLISLVPVNDQGKFRSVDFINMLLTKWK
jgi:calmodulin